MLLNDGELEPLCTSETIVLSEADHVGHIKLDRVFSIDSVRYQSYSDMQEMHDILALMSTDLLG